MEQVVFSEEAVAERIRLISEAYGDVVRSKERLEAVALDATSDFFTAVPSCVSFTTQYSVTARTAADLFRDAQAALDTVIDVFSETVRTMYASNESIADDFAAIDNWRLDKGDRPVPVSPSNRGGQIPI